MKTSASLHLLPFEVEETLLQLGGRVAAAHKARGLTQQDLAGHDSGSVAMLEASLPQRVRRKKAPQGAA
jgi:hypothetical protein